MEAISQPIEWPKIQPRFKLVEDDREAAIWDYARNVVSSFPDNAYPGRSMRYYCVDQVSGRWLGIVLLSSPLLLVKPRRLHIGWDNEQRTELLQRIANIAVCIPIQPFGMLLGGKLLALSTVTDEVLSWFETRYGEEVWAIETTSLFGKSSQYNRLKEFKYLGLTKGYGVSHVPDELWVKINAYHAHKGDLGTGKLAQRYILLNQVAAALGIKLRRGGDHGQRRGYYWAATTPNACQLFKGEESTPHYYDRPLKVMTDFWLERWYSMRLPKKIDEANAFDVSSYELDRQIPIEQQPAQRQAWLF